MATKSYQWRTSNWYNSTTPLSHGVIPDDQTWHTSTSETGSQTTTYWYRDANVAVGGVYSDANSSRVTLSITESWTVSFSNANLMTVTVNTVINSIVRDDVVGSNQDTPGRQIDISRSAGGIVRQSFTDLQVGTAHTISGSFTLDSHTFTIEPGHDYSRNSLFLHNEVIGRDSWDEINLGIEFKNTQPADYVPGKIWNGSIWLSHNRSGGTADIRNNSGAWVQMRTVNGGTDSDNPPFIRHTSGWKNMRLIGQG